MSNKFSIARIYAKAIFNIAIEQNNIRQWSLNLELFSKISQNTFLQPLCNNVSNTKKILKIFVILFEDYNKKKMDPIGKNFIYIIVKNHRTLLLPIIFEEFKNLYNNYIQSVIIKVFSAKTLHNSQLKKIAEIMRHRLSKKEVKIICHINKDILAGIIIKIKDTIIDGSLKGRILRLQKILQY